MRFLIKFSFPTESGNEMTASPDFGKKFQDLLKEIQAEAAYFCPVEGQRGGYVVASFNDASQIALVGERFWHGLNANVEIIPVMLPEDLAKAMPEIMNIGAKWGKK
jgi:hypothetical protein